MAYTYSKRKNPDDAICDLRCREGTSLKNIGFYFADGSLKQCREYETLKSIQRWASEMKIDIVIWTDLVSNFQEKSKDKKPFSIDAAISHIQALDIEGKASAIEYICHTPEFINTPHLYLRQCNHSYV